MAILTAFLVACVLALSTAKGSLIYIFLIYILLLCCKIIFQFNSIKKKLNKLLLEIQKEGSPCEWENFNTINSKHKTEYINLVPLIHTYFIHLFNYQFKMLQPVDMFVLNNCMKFQ